MYIHVHIYILYTYEIFLTSLHFHSFLGWWSPTESHFEVGFTINQHPPKWCWLAQRERHEGPSRGWMVTRRLQFWPRRCRPWVRPRFLSSFFRLMVVSISSSTVHQPWDGSKTLMVLWVTFTRQLLVVLAAWHRINPMFVSVATRSQLGTWGGPAGDWRRWNQGEGQGVVL